MTEKFNIKSMVKSLKEKYGGIEIASSLEETHEMLSTGNLALDLALEGGLAWGHVTEMAGLSASGKSLLLQQLMADAQKRYDAVCIFFDREKSYHKKRAEELGINNDNVILIEPQSIVTVKEMEIIAREIIPKIPEDRYKFIAIDSISAFSKEKEKADMGKKAQSLHNFFRIIIPMIDKKTALHFSNQVTFKIGILYGDISTVTGGESPKYYSTYRLKLDNKKVIRDEKKGNEIVGNWIKATIVKTRLGPSYREVVFPFYYKTGIPYYGGLARLLAEKNIVKPKNKTDFKTFKSHILLYNDERFNEFEIEKFLEKHPEIDISKYPEYKEDKK